MLYFMLLLIWAGAVLLKLAGVAALASISWWLLAPLPVYVGLGVVICILLVALAAYFGLSGYQKKLEKKAKKKPFEYPRG